MTRRLRPGIHRLVIHRASITHWLAMTGRGWPPGVGSPWRSSGWQASSCSAFLTWRRPTARHPVGTQARSSERKLISGKAPASRKAGPASSRSS